MTLAARLSVVAYKYRLGKKPPGHAKSFHCTDNSKQKLNHRNQTDVLYRKVGESVIHCNYGKNILIAL